MRKLVILCMVIFSFFCILYVVSGVLENEKTPSAPEIEVIEFQFEHLAVGEPKPVVMERSEVEAVSDMPLEPLRDKDIVKHRLEKELETEIEEEIVLLYDIPLEDELQSYVIEVSAELDVPHDIVFSIMWHETRYIDGLSNYNTNGTVDYGLCQINSVNWGWLLADHGLDVKDTKDNIKSAVVMLSDLLERYTIEQTLAAYASGEQGMLNGYGYWFSERIIEYASTLKEL